jgi:DNA (cytosine-5)-methyltransferase 1
MTSLSNHQRKLLKMLPGSEANVRVARSEGLLASKKRRPKLIDLFSGAGGLSLGFTSAFGHCFEPIWANDINKYAAASYNANFGSHCVQDDLNDVLNDCSFSIPQADVVVGGPPCQGFSLLNKNRNGDPRKQLWRPFLEVVKRSNASVFVMENVRQLVGSPEHAKIVEVARNMGFQTHHAILCAADYGVPQRRFRAIILGCNFADPKAVFPPRRTHFKEGNGLGRSAPRETPEYVVDPTPWETVRQAIGDLGRPLGTEIRDDKPPYDLHFGRSPTAKSRARYRAIPKEGMNRFDLQKRAPELTPDCWIRKTTGGTDLFGRLWWDRPALTIRTEFFKPEKGRYLHPKQHRPITHREAARFQSFPDAFQFLGTKIEIAKQIGNAVPPQLAACVADCVYALWLQRKGSNVRSVQR